ncbi:hypothetical protein DFR55_12217 [Herbinix hemicellulosilytica]|uniref:Cellulose biosynthesis protein BcsQ n=1 Tax=Herbinix hemicellulosilytica TaxID=1564487 RepID=A0A0H5SFC7_HERHM|nr:hypothetical protein [Herbinix hemicellulosilytica]RBP57502.1 hypothetical protein DFR55_12217 [Herbinix hemicellulosilytica]CRZ33725.1 hypothetical protein HHT355_0520 [Herbinix hemicellulosilytica]
MNIAFWSNAYDKSWAFLNFAGVSIASVMRYPYRITLLENYLDKTNLGKAFFLDNISYNRDGIVSFYEGKGIEGLLRRIYRGDKDPSLLKYYRRAVIPKHLYYIPQNGVINSNLFDYELYHNFHDLNRIIQCNTDLCFINVNQQNHLSSKIILQLADLVVINLYQDSDYLRNFFSNYSSLISKAVFIVGNYSMKSPLSCKRIAKLYEIPLEDIAPIPYNENFHIACKQGSAIEFINSNYFCDKESPNYLFIHGIRKAAYIILQKAEKNLALAKRG